MTFWQDAQIEPKRAYRFLMSVEGQFGGIKNFLIKKVNKPSFTVSESEHKYLNHTFYYPGKVTWNDVTFTIVDVVDPADDATAAVMSIFSGKGALQTGMGYQLPINEGVTSTISKKKSVSALGVVKIRQIDGDGRNVDAWQLNNAWIKDVKFGELDYNSEEMLNVDVTLRYDNAVYQGQSGKYPRNAVGANLL